MRKKSFLKSVFLVLSLVAVLIGITSFISYAVFGAANPIAVGVGLFKVTFTDAVFAQVQEEPKLIFFKQDYGIIKAMEEQSYTFLEEEQMGSHLVFEKDGVKYFGMGNGGRISYFRGD